MKMKFIIPVLLSVTCCFFSCQSHNQNGGAQTESSANPVAMNPTNHIPENRKEIRKEAVAQYREKTDNPLNDWYFSVALFETSKTFHYLVKLEFEELKGEDTLKLPNFGDVPRPVIQKGKEKYSCIIGFMDNENKFREYKWVHVDAGNHLKVTTLKHYTVTTYQE
jgi:hypothetical protein